MIRQRGQLRQCVSRQVLNAGRPGARLVAALIGLVLIACSAGPGGTSGGPLTVRVGYFPNLTHSQGLIGVANGTFQKALGPNVQLDVKVFNAGPSAIEAMFAGALDMTYIGPNPAINGFVKSKGQALRIVAGATSGGAVLVVRSDAGIHSPADFAGKRIASPQLGNTQDVALRHWLLVNGLKLTEVGGTTAVLPTSNPDILTLFLKKEIDGAWVPEPWGARLVVEANGQVFLDERDLWPNGQFVTTQLIVSQKFLTEHRDLVKRWVAAHVELTQWINDHPDEAKTILNREIERLTGQALPKAVLDQAWSRMSVTYDPIQSSLYASADSAFAAGFLGDQKPDLHGIYDLSILNEVLKEKGLPAITEEQP
jgi:NitT/TauT family transport system substrate-binding protein